MQYRVLGKTGIRVSRLCFGTLSIGPLQKNLPLREGERLLLYAVERGINFFDCAELYGTYPYMKEVLRQYPECVVTARSYAYNEETARASYEKALRELGRDYIDVFMLHEQESEYTLAGHKGAIDFFSRKKQEGGIGAFGISTHCVAGAKAAVKDARIDILHPLINMRGLGIADGTREEMEEQVIAAQRRGVGVYLMKSLGGGHLIAERDAAFAYAMSLPAAAIAVGMQSEQEIDYNCARFSDEEVSNELAKATLHAPRSLHIADWCEACGTCVKACRGGALSLEEGKLSYDSGRCVMCGYCGAKCPQFAIKIY